MLYFPIIENKIPPDWIPFFGGKPFTFFQPIFNIADASISTGVIVMLLFQKQLFKPEVAPSQETEEKNESASIQESGDSKPSA
jgi:signal peptidase II